MLEQHIGSKHGIKKKEFICNACQKDFPRSELLDQHVSRYHYKYICYECGLPFKDSRYLREHKQSHAVTKPFRCSVEGCITGYVNKLRLRTHYSDHHGLDSENIDRILNASEEPIVNTQDKTECVYELEPDTILLSL